MADSVFDLLKETEMTDIVKYKWTHTFDSASDAMETASKFHGILRGNPDYVKSGILLNVEGPTVIVAEFVDSKTHVRVEPDRAGGFSIKLSADGKF